MFGFGKWEQARATMVSHRETKRSSQGIAARYEFVADVTPPGGEAFRTTLGTPPSHGADDYERTQAEFGAGEGGAE